MERILPCSQTERTVHIVRGRAVHIPIGHVQSEGLSSEIDLVENSSDKRDEREENVHELDRGHSCILSFASDVQSTDED